MERRRLEQEDDQDQSLVHVDLGRHLRDPEDYTARRSTKQGGFCEVTYFGVFGYGFFIESGLSRKYLAQPLEQPDWKKNFKFIQNHS